MSNCSKHLDLGCGANPRNPFGAEFLYGVDIMKRVDESQQNNFTYVSANVVLDPIPFPDNTFDSISAYDFLEHVPRILYVEGKTVFPFVDIMSEIHRVLKPGGTLYAITPVYPKRSAFVDPTHVNFLTVDSYKYFCYPNNWASMYGFKGSFVMEENKIVKFSIQEYRKGVVKKMILSLIATIFPFMKQHILWVFKAKK
jgi:SAM-dependent methyltransferase